MTQPEPDTDFEALLDYLKRARGFDFSAYKRSTLMRRVRKRMQASHVEHFADYMDFLEVHPDEFADLFNTILINVTGFFRDTTTWEYLRNEVIPGIIAQKDPAEPVRVWSAGCASGEEAFSAAMLLAEILGTPAYFERVKIYATDMDEEALEQARRAVYPRRAIEGVPEDLLQRYFERSGDHFAFDRELRRYVIFGRHDLIHDAPISRVDMLLCRNTLMYFNAEAQEGILARFHFALNDNGYLVLGRTETQLTRTNMFTPGNLKLRVFRKSPDIHLRERLQLLRGPSDDARLNHLAGLMRLRDIAFELSPLAHIVVDADGHLALANQKARALFRLSLDDINRPLQDLEISYRPVELRSLLEQATAQRQPIRAKDVKWDPSGHSPVFFAVDVTPIVNGSVLGASVTFEDVTEHKRLEDERLHYNQELETAYEELQSTNEELQTTNEELQSTIEELETTNEELQSTNEELETMNEELQSTNEETETLNDELSQRTDEMNRANALLTSILSSIREGMIVVDRDLHILAWNRKAEDLWGLRADEVRHKHLLNLDIGLPVDQLRPLLRGCFTDGTEQAELTVPAVNRRGRPIRVRVTCTRLAASGEAAEGAILQMQDEAVPANDIG